MGDVDYAISAEQLRFFEENGYLGPFSCEAPEWRQIPVRGVKGFDLHLTDAAVFAVCSHASVAERVGQLLGPGGISVFKSRVWAKPPGDDMVVPWHQDVGHRNGGFRADGSPAPTITAWMALSEVTGEMGAVRRGSFSHTQ